VAADHRNFVPDEVLQRHRDEEQRRLESELTSERARLARDQQNELRAQAQSSLVGEIRKRQAAEQQAFEEHAARQRQVMAQRIQKQILKPGKNPWAQADQNRDKDKNKDKGTRQANGGD
jgi:hypothetical protein